MEDFREAFRVLRRYWREFLLAVLGPSSWLLAYMILSGVSPQDWVSGWRHLVLSTVGLTWFALSLWWFFRRSR